MVEKFDKMNKDMEEKQERLDKERKEKNTWFIPKTGR